MRCALLLPGSVIALALAGCGAPTATDLPSSDGDRAVIERPAPTADPREAPPPVASAGGPEVSFDTRRDQKFAEFLRENSGGMVKRAAVGIERKGELSVELDESVAPEDTLDLTNALLSGARNDFPNRPILLKLYDPSGEPILRARYRPGQGVDYQLAGAEGETRTIEEPGDDARANGSAGDALARGGVTEKDRDFARWAEETGQSFLRYVQADLERNGRLWFGITRDVAPDDLPELTESLLEGARSEFPGRELQATVFDPDGERIGTAHLDRRGRVRWER